jgi:type IV pilus assembly protein PilA
MTVCPYCQAQNADTAAFCIRCGQPVGGASGTAAASRATGEGEKKGLAVTSLVFGILSIPTMSCLGVGALVAIVCGIIALVKAKNEPNLYGGKGMAIAGIVTGGLSFLLIPFIGIIAAIAIPSMLRARVSANESAAIGDVRTVISAQSAYAAANGGHYDTLECLGTPNSCIPRYSGPTFLDPTLTSGQPKNGYTRVLHLGPPPQEGDVNQPVSPTSVTSYAYVAVPVQRGQTGVRAFCGDARGIICYTIGGDEPDVVDGECQVGPSCPALR